MHVGISQIESESSKKSIIHSLDGRIKLIITLCIIIYAVYTTKISVLWIMELYLLVLILVSKVSFSYAIKRVLLILPFGGFIALFQPFIVPGVVIYTLPLDITITYEGAIFGILLLSRLIVCLTAVVLLSSVTPIQEIVNSGRRMGFPRELALILSLTIRYLFMFYDELERIRNAQKTRCFDIWNKKTSYMWRLRQIAYTIVMLFLRSYEQGEKVYFSMLSRGYTGESDMYREKKKMSFNDYLFIVLTLILILAIELIRYFYFI
ncbi:cobalt ECF transporter T component CbiQ [Methanobacterium movens]